MGENKEAYIEFCRSEKSLCIYDQPWWLDYVTGGNWDVLLYKKGDAILATLPFFQKKRLGMSYITQPPLTQHNGIKMNYPKDAKYQKQVQLLYDASEYFICELEKRNLICYQQSYSPEFTNWIPFYWAGYKQTVHYTYRLPVAETYEKIRGNYSSSIKRQLKISSEEAQIHEFDDMELFYSIQNKTFEKQGLKNPYSLEWLIGFDEILKRNQARKMYIAIDTKRNVHCVEYIVYDSSWAYLLMSGADPKYKKSNYPNLLVDAAIRFASETQRGFDFEGSMLPGVEAYYRKFGATADPYFYLQKIYTQNPILRKYILKRNGPQ
jgi:hypothetical protein